MEMLGTRLKCDIHGGQERGPLGQWTFTGLLLFLCIGCASLYGCMRYSSAQMQECERSIQKQIQYVKFEEQKTMAYLTRQTIQHELDIQRQNAFVQNLISQAEALFDEIEIASQMFGRSRPTLFKKTTPLDPSSELTELSYTNEYGKRKVENIFGELWNFIHAQLRKLEKLEFPTENSNWQDSTPQHFSQTSSSSEFERLANLDSKEGNESSYDELQTVSSNEEDAKEIVSPTAENKVGVDYNSGKINLFKLTWQGELDIFKQELLGYKRAMIDSFELLRKADNADKLRLIMSKELGNLVQRRLNVLQNPKNCDTSQTYECSMKDCGFGCNFHHIMYCLITAYATNKTMTITKSLALETLFESVSKSCSHEAVPKNERENPIENDTDANRNINIIFPHHFGQREYARGDNYIPFIEDLHPFPLYLPLSIPQDLAPKLAIFHGNPAAWWTGQIASFLFKPTKVLMNHLRKVKRTLGFQTPIVGVHVRRTDKIHTEAAFHAIEEYMLHVDDFYDQLQRSMPNVTRRVFLATDEYGLLSEARSKYPSYTFISDTNSSNISMADRARVDSVMGVAADIYFLSRCNFLVCTFSSQVCRLAYELMQALHGDASTYFRSLDDIYYFGGQDGHRMTAIESHEANFNWPGTINITKGDSIKVHGNHWNGFSKGRNERTGNIGLYPSYKVEDNIPTHKMPVYSSVFG